MTFIKIFDRQVYTDVDESALFLNDFFAILKDFVYHISPITSQLRIK